MIKCIKCGRIESILKAGFLRGNQRFYCKECKIHFTEKRTDEQQNKIKKKNHQTTIIDIAQALGLSNSTVSRALHDHPEVNPNTRKAVMDMAAELDYQPNLLAYNLVKSQSKVIGTLVPEFYHTFFPSVIIGIQEVLSKAGYNQIIMQSDESYMNEVTNTKILLASRIDGLLVSLTKETNNFDHFKVFEKKQIPMVFFNRVCDEINAPKIIVDDYSGAFQAVEHLITNGNKRIAHLAGPPNLLLSQQRLKGYKDALKKHGLPIEDDLIIHSDLTESKARIYSNHLLELPNPPDAIFAVNDPSAIEIIQLARQKGIKIPEQLAVVGFSDDPIAAFIEPGLTTIAQPTQEMGRVAAQTLLNSINSESVHSDSIIKTLDVKLVVRGSSGLKS